MAYRMPFCPPSSRDNEETHRREQNDTSQQSGVCRTVQTLRKPELKASAFEGRSRGLDAIILALPQDVLSQTGFLHSVNNSIFKTLGVSARHS